MKQRWYHRVASVFRKEFQHIFRDMSACLLLFLMPAVILLIFGYALSFEPHHHEIWVGNPDHVAEAETLFARLEAHPKIKVCGRVETLGDIDRAFTKGNTRAVLLYRRDGIDIFIDATAFTISNNIEILLRSLLSTPDIQPHVRFVYNPATKKAYTPIPGLVMMVFILVGSIVLGTSINREKVGGSFRLLRVTRLSSLEIILGKSAPYFLISLLHVGFVYLICLHFDIHVQGSLPLFFGLCVLYALCCLSLGLLIASWFDRPLDVVILCWIVLFIPNVFLSGFVFPVSAMSPSVQSVAELLPGTAFVTAFRNIAYKGTGFGENLSYFLLLGGETLLAGATSLLGFRRKIPR